jgi:hypothetical protein
MVKVEYENREGVVRLLFTSNSNDELDLLDSIGNAILTNSPKRGSYQGDTMIIDIKKPEA